MGSSGGTVAQGQRPWVINKWLALLISSMGAFMATLDAGVVGVSFPALVSHFHTDTSTILWVSLSYFAVGTGLLPTMGWVGDQRGRRKIFTLGFIIFTSGLAVAALSQTVLQLILARLIQGVGQAMIMSNGLAIIVQAFPRNERGKALGMNGAVLGLGLGGGPAIGGIMLDALGWQALFYTRLPLGLIGIALAWLFLPKDDRDEGPMYLDYWGAMTLFSSMAVFLLMISLGGRLGFSSPVVLLMAALTVILLPAFVFVEKRAKQPIIDLALFGVKQFRQALILHILHYLIVGSIAFLTPFYLINGLSYSASKAGLFITIFFILRLPFAPVSGWLSDRLGSRILSLAGLALLAIGVSILSRLGTGASEWSIALSLVIAGLGSSMFEPTNSSAIMGAVSQNRLGTASASVSTGRQVALSTGTAVAGTVFILREQVYSARLQGQGFTESMASSTAVARAFGDGVIAIVIPVILGLILAAIARGEKGPGGNHTEQTLT